MMTITLDPIKHTGAAPEPIVLLAEAEQLTFTGATLTDNMAATILSPTGTALASGLIAGNAVTLDTRTSQAWDYISAQACGVTAPALLAIGDANALVAVLPIRVLRNNLYNLAPPSETVTVYPSMAELQEILERMHAAETNLEALIEQAQSIDANIGEVVRDFQAAVTAAETLINQTVTDGVASIDSAKKAALGAVDDRTAQAIGAIGDAETEALQSLEQKKTDSIEEMESVKETVEGLGEAAAASATQAAESAARVEEILTESAITVETEAVLAASRDLIGTDPGDLVTLSAAI